MSATWFMFVKKKGGGVAIFFFLLKKKYFLTSRLKTTAKGPVVLFSLNTAADFILKFFLFLYIYIPFFTLITV